MYIHPRTGGIQKFSKPLALVINGTCFACLRSGTTLAKNNLHIASTNDCGTSRGVAKAGLAFQVEGCALLGRHKYVCRPKVANGIGCGENRPARSAQDPDDSVRNHSNNERSITIKVKYEKQHKIHSFN